MCINCDLISSSSQHQLNVLELYSGLGGFHYALKDLKISNLNVTAIEINDLANKVYQHNHPNVNLINKNIQGLRSEEVDQLQIDVLTMSPPCQPFTRLGLKKDIEDARTDSFLHLLQLLPDLKNQPKFIMLENVKGFEISNAREILITTLRSCSYEWQEFLLNSYQLNIPNSRLRYYCIAKKKSSGSFCFETKHHIHHEIPSIYYHLLCPAFKSAWFPDLISSQNETRMTLSSYLHDHLNYESINLDQYLIPDKILLKYHSVLDIVMNDSTQSNCFTKSYSTKVEATGSVLTPKEATITYHEVHQRLSSQNELSDDEKLNILKQLKLRYFTPKEISNLMCFPNQFNFPPDLTLKQRYRLLGNSLNVCVVSFLLKLLLISKSDSDS